MSIACVALGIALLATGCKKDEVKDTFNLNAVIEEVNGGQKVHMEGSLPVWDNGDAIRVNNEDCNVSITGSGSTRKNSIAKQTEDPTYCAFYPASYLDANTNLANERSRGIWMGLPQRQEYSKSGNNQIVRMPMIAYSNTTNLHFRNLCSVLKVTVTNSTDHQFKLDSIQVKSDKANLWGRCSLSLAQTQYTDDNNNIPNGMSNLISGGKVVTLCGANKTSMNETFAKNASKTFYIVVPVVSNNNADTLRIRLGIEEGFLVNKKTPAKVSVARNKLLSMAFSATDFEQPIDVIVGPFTVDANGTKVSFSTGNLWWDKNTNKYKLEAQQHYYQPSVNTDAEKHISHFWWKKDILPGYTSAAADQPQSVNEWLFTNDPNSPNKANRSFEVEGTYRGTPVTAKGKFRVLTDDEWQFLIEGRYRVPGLINATSSIGAAMVTLTDVTPLGGGTNDRVSGIVIIPDGSSVDPRTLTTLAAVNNAGAVFMPMAGGRYWATDLGTTPPFTYNDCWYHPWLYTTLYGPYNFPAAPVGDYWTSNILRVDKATTFTFGFNVINGSNSGVWNGAFSTWGEGTRTIGRTIRLVCKYVGN